MGRRTLVVLGIFFATFFHISYGCQMEGVGNWAVPVAATILDTFRGIVLSRSATNIEAITGITYGGATLRGPYLDISLINSQFVIETNEAYAEYEEHEVSGLVSLTVDFRCSGTIPSNSLTILINIEDTNNNNPVFIPTNEFEFFVTPPLPPGYIITGCLDYITARDIDLTTQRIEFTIDDNPYFEIEYDESASTVAKEFKAIIKTKTFIRSLPEPLTYIITATDVDLTQDPPLSATATLRVVADSDFQFPEEPIFSQAFYLANYTESHELNLFETIALEQGFDEYVSFVLEGEFKDNFDLVPNGNEISLDVINPVPRDIWSQRQTYLIVRALREFTSGDTATLVIQFPEEEPLQFENAIYEGAIINNSLQVSQLVLAQGYNSDIVAAYIEGEYSSYFTALVQGNLIMLSMLPLSTQIVESNNFISIQVIASSDRSEATTVVNLEIVKDDNVTPVFDKSIYYATYDPDSGLDAEQIIFAQGFDETVDIELGGDYAYLFQYNQNGLVITLTSSTIPPELYSLQSILITIEASKPRTVGAKAVISIALPAAREIEFEESIYRGTIDGNEIRLDTIQLRTYQEGVVFQLSGEYSTYFTATPSQQGQVVILLSSVLPDTVITQNSVILLTLTAAGTNIIPISTNILLDIIKEDTTTPLFTRNIYYGSFETTLQIEDINLAQGYDGGVTFRLDGAHAQYFLISSGENNAIITLRDPIPEDVIFNEKVLLFNVIADKPLTVGANAAVRITFPTELTDATVMRFSQSAYIGHLEENELTLENNIVLDTGYAAGTEFNLTGDFSEHFSLHVINNEIQVTSLRTLPNEVFETNDFLLLEVEAKRQRAVSAWTSIVVHLVKQQNIAPVFNQAYYTGVYTEEIGLIFEEAINLEEGYDVTVTFALVGEWSSFFRLSNYNETVMLVLDAPIPTEVLESHNHLLLTVVAENANNLTGRAVIVIDLPKELTEEPAVLGFDRVTYIGSIENGQSNIPTITISEGYTQGVQFALHGDLSNFFSVTPQGATVTVALQNVIPDQLVPDNRIIVLELQATAPGAIPAFATIVVEYVTEQDIPTLVELIFAQTFYSGSYSAATGLSFPIRLSLTEGYDSSVVFDLEGDNAQWFGLERNENSVTVVLTSPIPAGVLSNNQQLVFVVSALRPGSATARATVVIQLTDELTEDSAILGFDRVTYIGSIENGQSNIPTITLSEGYTQGVQFALLGDLSNFFSVTPQGATVTVALQNVIPDQLVPDNRIIVLELQATAPGAIPAFATIVVEYVTEQDIPTLVELIFAQTFYSGSYSAATGFSFPIRLSLTEGYDSSVVFDLEGDNAQWFGLERNENSVTVVLTSPIPAGVLSNNQQLVFVVSALRPGSATARATVVIQLTDELTEDSAILGFDRVTYIGSIENGQSNIPTITLSEGYTQGVQFALLGDLSNFFSVTPQGATVTVALQNVIPDQLVPDNRIIVLELQATAPGAIPAFATIVVEYVMEQDIPTIVELIFAQTFYSGSYSAATGLSFPIRLSLTEGYDSSVVFDLEGDNAQWFGLERNENSVTVVLTSPIPAGVLSNNQQLVFVVSALRPGSATARATVVIQLTDELTEDSAILGFDRVTYIGSIENGQSNIPTITLSEGYTQGVQFALLGDLSNFFSVTPQGATVTVALQNVIPDQLVPDNRIIVLELQATAPGAIPAFATIVVEYVMEQDIPTIVELIFAQTFYSGSYSAATGLSFPIRLSLTEGYDSSVVFDLEGDNAQWFGLERNENSVTVVLTSPIPAGVLSNNQQLVFVVSALRPGSATARATVVIQLTDELTEDSAILGFDRVTYIGSIENGQSNIPTITLSEGYTQGVQFALLGDLSNFFSVTPQGATVTVALQNVIPDQLVPDNRIIVLELQATAPGAIPAFATIVVEYVTEQDIPTLVELIFAQTFYSGSYSAATGFSFPIRLSLTEGYDSSVVFDLEGDNAQWFGLERNENSVTVVLTSPIPAGVLSNNQQLVFVVSALRPGSATARATVVIQLTDELTEDSAILGFDRVTYIGSIENGQSNIPTITLSEGYTQGVQFALHGDLFNFFSVTPQGATVTVALQNVIPDQLVPDNRIIVLELQATAPGAIPAFATIVVEYVTEQDIPTLVELIFAQTFYSGSYSAATGLSFPIPLSLTEGYDSSVVFDLEGDNAQWFGLERNENSVTVVLTSPIPAGVLSNNQQLVFVVSALRPGSATARATVVIQLTDELTEDSAILGFDRVTYIGSIENGQSNIPTITLSEGYTQGVQFALHGDLSNFFSVTPQGATVTVALQNVIPDQLVPDNRIIVLELQATAPGAIPAFATIVVEYVTEQDIPTLVELIFAQTFYSGSYSAATGLSFPTPLSLTEGYDSSVVFDLEGDNAQWFGLERNENSVTVVLTSPIPAGVLSNNQQLVFVVSALRPGSATARATVVIQLTNDSQAGFDVTFEKVLYEGIVQNDVVSHESIIITGFFGSNIELHGEYSTLFQSELSNNEVRVQASETFTLPADLTHVVLELRAETASAVLVLNIIQTDGPSIPTVTFSSPSYAIRVDITQTGRIGQVQATSDNGESLRYSLLLDNAHLEERLSVNSAGELYLSASVNSGVYTFQVIATTMFTQTTGTATVHLSVEAVTVCGGENVVAPLIVLDVDEEEPHHNLIVGTPDNCHYTLTNRWPLDQSWVYVDEQGVHSVAIDREHESIAFMPLSQVQVELILHCEDDATRSKRSVNPRTLGPYDYGNNKWILTDTIQYNSRRTLFNLIVNDINDNAPIFVGKESEPIAVGHVVQELAERVLPRSLAELQATDADIGENAALLYWSAAPELAVSPTTGFVHVSAGATLTNGATFTVNATDRNGEGLTGSIDILVRLLDESNIAVVTIRDAFLDEEQTILSQISEAVEYDVKVLRSVVISDSGTSEENSRKRRDVTDGAGASLQLYVYGLIEREPVAVDRLTTDISNTALTAVIIVSTVSLEDHLEAQEICVIAGRDTGLLVATIVLSVLLFIVLVLIAVWFFLRWRRKKNYDEFSDENSLASRSESIDKLPGPEVIPKPRLDIAELRKSEKRLQEMLDAPIEVITEPTFSRNDAILDIPTPAVNTPIVIQSIDKLKDAADESSDDEFGEVKNKRRKSVVTFNENVEKIIHLEDNEPEDISTDSDYEVYKL